MLYPALQAGMAAIGGASPAMLGLPADVLAALQGMPISQQYQTQQVQPLMVPSTSTQQTPTGQQTQPTQPTTDLSQYSQDQLMHWARKYGAGGPGYNPHVINALSDELRRRQLHGKQ